MFDDFITKRDVVPKRTMLPRRLRHVANRSQSQYFLDTSRHHPRASTDAAGRHATSARAHLRIDASLPF